MVGRLGDSDDAVVNAQSLRERGQGQPQGCRGGVGAWHPLPEAVVAAEPAGVLVHGSMLTGPGGPGLIQVAVRDGDYRSMRDWLVTRCDAPKELSPMQFYRDG